MRLVQDFNMYYSGTYIGYRETPESPLLPFYIEEVFWGGDSPSSSEEYEGGDWYDSEEYNDYSEEAYDFLVFQGNLILSDSGRGRDLAITGKNDPRLEFKNPLLGFVQTRSGYDSKTWLTYRVSRSVKKGLAYNRISSDLSNFIAWNIFADFDKDRIERDYWFDKAHNFIKYRHNTVVAIKDADVEKIYLDPLAQHLKSDLEELFPTCQILIEEL